MDASHTCWLLLLLLLAALQLSSPASAQDPVNTTTTTTTSSSSSSSTAGSTPVRFLTRPADVTVAVGEPAVFRCGVPEASAVLTFVLSGSQKNFSLSCPEGHVEDIPQAVVGSCDVKNGELVAVWTLKGTSYSDDGARVVCRQSQSPDAAAAAVLHVYENGISQATLIGCLIGAFFGVLLVFALLFLLLRRSSSFQNCFGVSETEDDLDTIVPKD